VTQDVYTDACRGSRYQALDTPPSGVKGRSPALVATQIALQFRPADRQLNATRGLRLVIDHRWLAGYPRNWEEKTSTIFIGAYDSTEGDWVGGRARFKGFVRATFIRLRVR
jgi:hypothetical protein